MFQRFTSQQKIDEFPTIFWSATLRSIQNLFKQIMNDFQDYTYDMRCAAYL